jgi:hypothetical protein
VPLRAGDVDVSAEEAAGLGEESCQLRPFRLGNQQVRAAQLGDPTDVILVQVRDDRGVDIGRGVAEGTQLGVERLVLADLRYSM